MERRNFIKKSMAAAGTAIVSTAIGAPAVNAMAPGKKFWKIEKYNFNLPYAPHFGMFENMAGKDLIDQLKYMADVGFTALEDNGMMGRDVATQEKIASEMVRLGMKMGVFVVDGGDNWKVSLATGQTEFKDTFIKTCRKAVDVAKRCNATWMTVVPGYFDRTRDLNHQTSSVIDALRAGAEIFEPHNLVMVLEPLSDNPDLFLRFSPQTYLICKAVNSPSCKILYDIYHMQRNEGDLIKHMEQSWDEIAYIQIGDNPGRKEPTTGEINYKNVFKYIDEKGYEGILGMEHGLSKPGKDGEQALVDAYKQVDQFK
ncbi:MAG: TIM barrel protein [Cyclobacteriaceae bacterium]|nr:TIM barrel protein [Cyclobacteriaceae bacterium]